MRQGAFLVNTARGGLVDEKALAPSSEGGEDTGGSTGRSRVRALQFQPGSAERCPQT
uniref:D-isomer specific 2-hydroxyacid dehydrogenase NAD-binding domain-containing protein n=1 Tax=Anguilla anguilla TaxID=7936 RepID=A0A0E9PGP3_ANGAN